jgi:hypothetical protein
MTLRWSSRAALLAAAAAAALLVHPVRGEDRASGGSKAPASASGSPATAALQEMSRTLASAPSLRFRVRSLRPMKLEDGRWITLVGDSTVSRQGKDRLRVDTGGDFFPFQLYYDGKTLTAYAPEKRVYAQDQAPGTIDDALARAEKRGEATFEFRDLLSSDPYKRMSQGLVNAMVVGTSTVDGAETQHLAVHGKKLDWEIWIGKTDHLPRMVTLTDLADARKPTQTALFTNWEVGGAIPADAFTFNAPTDASKVPFRDPRQATAEGAAPARSGTGGGQ